MQTAEHTHTHAIALALALSIWGNEYSTLWIENPTGMDSWLP